MTSGLRIQNARRKWPGAAGLVEAGAPRV